MQQHQPSDGDLTKRLTCLSNQGLFTKPASQGLSPSLSAGFPSVLSPVTRHFQRVCTTTHAVRNPIRRGDQTSPFEGKAGVSCKEITIAEYTHIPRPTVTSREPPYPRNHAYQIANCCQLHSPGAFHAYETTTQAQKPAKHQVRALRGCPRIRSGISNFREVIRSGGPNKDHDMGPYLHGGAEIAPSRLRA